MTGMTGTATAITPTAHDPTTPAPPEEAGGRAKTNQLNTEANSATKSQHFTTKWTGTAFISPFTKTSYTCGR